MRDHHHWGGTCPMVPPCAGFQLRHPGRGPRIIRGNVIFVADAIDYLLRNSAHEQFMVPRKALEHWMRWLWGFSIAPARRGRNKFTVKYERNAP